MPERQIDALTFVTMEARIPELGKGVEDITPRGKQDGHVELILGLRAGEGFVRTFNDYATLANAETHLANCMAKQGEIVDLYDDLGRRFRYLRVIRVMPAGPRGQAITRYPAAVGGAVGGLFAVDLLWAVRQTARNT